MQWFSRKFILVRPVLGQSRVYGEVKLVQRCLVSGEFTFSGEIPRQEWTLLWTASLEVLSPLLALPLTLTAVVLAQLQTCP